MNMMGDFFFIFPILAILFNLVIFGVIVYIVITALKLAKERNAYLKTIAEELQRRP